MSLAEEIKTENKIVSDWLLWYPDRKKEYENKRKNILLASPPAVGDGQPKGKNISDPTGLKGQRLADLAREAGWLAVIEEVQERLPWKMQIFLKLRQEYRYSARGPRGWTVAVQHKYAEEVAQRSGKQVEDVWVESRVTFIRWWRRIVEYTARLASKRGLL